MAFEMNNVTMQNITDIMNVSSPTELFININHDIYGSWLFFFLIATLWVILFFIAQSREDAPLANLTGAGVIPSIVSLLLRGVYIMELGAEKGLLTDFQLWIIPLTTIIFAMILYFMKRE